MTKPWNEQPLWWKVYLRDDRIHLECGKLIGHLGVSADKFWAEAKKLPNFDKYRFENAVRDLTAYVKREEGRYELTGPARKVLRVVLGPAPDDPEYRVWWAARMVSVRLEREQGREPTHAAEPPVPILDLEIPARGAKEEPKPEKKPRARKKKSA